MQPTLIELEALEQTYINGNRKDVRAALDAMPHDSAIYAAAWLAHAFQLNEDPAVISSFLRLLGDRLEFRS